MKRDSSRNLSRRNFLAGAATTGIIAAAGAMVGCTAKPNETANAASEDTTSTETRETWNKRPESVATQVEESADHEIIVVGAGNSGVICALKAAQLGGEVLILEQSNAATAWAGDIGACDSQIMKDKGINVDKEFIIHDLVRYASGKCDENLIRLWAYNSGAFVDWYQENLQKKGLDVLLDSVKKEFYPADSFFTNVYHTAYKPPLEETANPMGSEVAMPALLELFAEAGGRIQFDATVVELIQDDSGRVTGVITQEGKTFKQYNASRGVVLATGGFLGNKDMMEELGVVSHKYCSNHIGGEGRNGDGIKLATWAGAKMDSSHAGSMLIFDRGCITTDEANGDIGGQGGACPSLWWPGSQPFLRVNALGQRFCNEDGPYDFEFNLAVQQPGHFWWQLFDSSSWDDVVSFGTSICSRVVAAEDAKNCLLLGQYYPCRNAEEWDKVYIQPNVENGNLIKCETVTELAETMNVPVETLTSTIDRYNSITDSGTDTDHGKAPWRLSKIDEPPFYAAKMSGWALATLSGVHVNYDLKAIDEEGKAIEGLYMSGLDVGGFFNGNYPEYYGGLCMGRCTTLAWLVAHSLMEEPYPTPIESARLAY